MNGYYKAEAKTTGSDEMLFIENLSIKDTQSIDSSTFREGER